MKTKTTAELLKMRASYLGAVDKVTGPTGAQVIKALGKIEAELERRGYITVIKGRGFNLGNDNRLEGPGFSFDLYPTAEAAHGRISGFNAELEAHGHGQGSASYMFTWEVLRHGGTLGFINANLGAKRALMSLEVVPFDLARVF